MNPVSRKGVLLLYLRYSTYTVGCCVPAGATWEAGEGSTFGDDAEAKERGREEVSVTTDQVSLEFKLRCLPMARTIYNMDPGS